jgi:ABC-type Fe3+/spermidine/putrescine transport system ATPase subunit
MLACGGGKTVSDAVLLHLENVVKRFGTSTAVDGVDFSVNSGEFLTLLGPSGCGKTTILRMIAGFETPTSGRILLDGKDIAPLPPWNRPVNTVFQQYALFPHLTVGDNVAFGLRRKGVSSGEIGPRVKEALESVRLGQFADRLPSQLSGGQQQRVALARALVNKPRLLLLDEPLSALDHMLRVAMREELRELQQKAGIAFVFVTHDQGEALAMSDRIAVIGHGRVHQLATPTDVYERPADRYVASFLGAANVLRAKLVAIDGDAADVQIEGGPAARIRAGEYRPAAGTDVDLVLRPDFVAMCGGPVPGAVSWQVRITDRQYHGQFTQWRAEGLGKGTIEATATRSQVGSEIDPKPGTQAWAVFPSQSLAMLPIEGT